MKKRYRIGFWKVIFRGQIYFKNLKTNQQKNKMSWFMCQSTDHRKKAKTKLQIRVVQRKVLQQHSARQV